MQIVNSIVEDFGGFTLDANAIGLRSISDTDIKLPYNGALPKQMLSASSTYIYINVQLVQTSRVVLVVEKEDGKTLKRPLVASSKDILSLLDEFFAQPHEATGLSEYWLGLWQAHYNEWRRVAKEPNLLLNILFTLPEQNRRFLQKHMMDETAAA